MVNSIERILTWKYFWLQKFTEVFRVLLIASIIFFLPFMIGHNIGDNKDILCGNNIYLEQDCLVAVQWIEGIMYIFLTLIIIALATFLLYLMYSAIQEWIQSNWEKASKRAKADIRKIKRKGNGK